MNILKAILFGFAWGFGFFLLISIPLSLLGIPD